MGRELSAHLTDEQIKALDILSLDYGLTNRELTRRLGKKEIDEGNTQHTATKPLLDAGLIYQVKGKYPNKYLFIDKSYENIFRLKYVLDDPVSGKITYYQKAHHIEQNEYEKRKWAHLRDNDEPPEISDAHFKIRSILRHCIHLYKWCDKIEKELQTQMSKENTRPNFSLLSPRPQCKLCKEELKKIKLYEYSQEHQRIIFEDGAYDLKELKFAPL